jgi:hypothetical protein
VSSVCVVPQTALTVWRHLVASGFTRFRPGAHAFALQLSMGAIPLVVADSSLATSLGADQAADVVAGGGRTVVPSRREAVILWSAGDNRRRQQPRGWRGGWWPGLATTRRQGLGVRPVRARRQPDRGVHRDRPVLRKYGRAALLAGSAGM